MHVQHQKGISQTIPKDPIDDHKTHIVRRKKYYYSLLCLLPLQRNPHLPSATVGLLSSPSATANLHTIHILLP